MPLELVDSQVGPAVAAAVAMAVTLMVRSRSRARKVEALNRSLHEIRRPLQVLALALPEVGVSAPTDRGRSGRTGSSDRVSCEPVRQAISALAHLDRQINGAGVRAERSGRSELIAARLMVDACVRRWLPFARLSGSTLSMAWSGPDVLVRGDGTALAAALENLITNAIEHGGPEIRVSGLGIGRKLRLVVADSGTSVAEGAAGRPKGVGMEALAGVAGHGHGLEVVRETVAVHGGRFEAEFGSERSEAVMVLPISPARRSTGSEVKVNW